MNKEVKDKVEIKSERVFVSEALEK